MTPVPVEGNQGRVAPLEYIFHPRSIAVAGLSTDPARAWLSECYITPMLEMGYRGPLYVINPKGGQIAGLPVYGRLQDIPGPVDYVISCIPAQLTPQLLEECVDKGVRVVQLYTAGFTETGEQEGIELQRRLLRIARRGDLRLLGPNCMGIYCPGSAIGFCSDYPRETGPIGLLCQSGGNTGCIVRAAAARGLRFSKVISYGNACDINECDLLDYLADDPETRVIAAYIEGTTDGRRLFGSLTRAASAKPVVIFKAGYTDGGSRATASHTGSLAGADAVWNGFLQQVGAIRVFSVEEMADVLVALLCMEAPRGKNTCAVSTGGGASVLAADDCEQAGLRLVPIPHEIGERMKALIPLAGGMLRNPIDAFPIVGSYKGWQDLVPILEDWRELDIVIFHYAFDAPPVPVRDWLIDAALKPMIAAAKMCRLPAAMVLHSVTNDASWQVSLKTQQLCLGAGLPFFLSVRGASQAIRKLIEFNKAYPDKVAGLHTLEEQSGWS